MLRLADLRVRDVMTPNPATLLEDETLLDALALLREKRIHSAPVIGRDGVVVSVLSTTDLVDALAPAFDWRRSPEGRPPDETTLSSLASRGVGELAPHTAQTCPPELPLIEACQRMVSERVHRLVVVKDKQAVGVVAAVDVARAVACLAALGPDEPFPLPSALGGVL